MSIYDFKLKNINNQLIDFAQYQNKLILIVNVASKCGFVNQYQGLEEMYNKYKDQGLIILGFPCMQFKEQEFASNEQIKEFCTIKYNVTFDIFSKIDVKGENQSPLYHYLTNEFPWSKTKKDVQWNFEKFLINRQGEVINRFPSYKKPKKIAKIIEKLI